MATNRKFERGTPLSVAVASTVGSNDPVILGEMGGGVALTDYDSVSGKATVAFDGVYDLSVKGVNNAGNVAVAVGDALYYVSGDTPVLSKKRSGVFFGYALEAVDSGATDTIMVRLAQAGGTGGGYYGAGVFVSTEQTATGSAVNTAHGLGAVPSKVVAILTEFASNLSIDITPGSHDATNAIFTIANGAKYIVVAWK